jgi:pyruvate formate-lyase activating enzyme-like uncharacterized protein
MIKLQSGNKPIITFYRFVKTVINCYNGHHTPVQMDSDCWYCGLRAEKAGNSYYDDTWPLKARLEDIKKIASHYYCW